MSELITKSTEPVQVRTGEWLRKTRPRMRRDRHCAAWEGGWSTQLLVAAGGHRERLALDPPEMIDHGGLGEVDLFGRARMMFFCHELILQTRFAIQVKIHICVISLVVLLMFFVFSFVICPLIVSFFCCTLFLCCFSTSQNRQSANNFNKYSLIIIMIFF